MLVQAHLLALLVAGAGCGEDPVPPEPPSGGHTVLPCEPACGGGYACVDGTCIAACEPACPAGTQCTPAGRCLADSGAGPGPAFERNPCGGAGALPQLPGEPCGPCGLGRILCETEESVYCVDPVGTNGCGGCAALPGEPLAPCGEPDDATRWACISPDELACLPFAEVNPCGGVTVLEWPPGRACGHCGHGYAVCEGHEATGCLVPDGELGPCACQPGESPPIPCGTDTGVCDRGLRFCQPGGEYGTCVVARAGAPCEHDDDCGEGGWCLDERVAPVERFDDDCREAGDGACQVRRCRHLEGTRACDRDADCAPSQACGAGRCHPMVTRPGLERCNGRDDSCNGFIDDDHRRREVCGACPFNMRLVAEETPQGLRWFCIDHYEASRADATADSAGVAAHYAASREGVRPWTTVTPEEAVSACAGLPRNRVFPGSVPTKRLCLWEEWVLVCGAEQGWDYPYGTEYVAGMCHDEAVSAGEPLPTGELPECAAAAPGGGAAVLDLSGNAAEWVRGPSGAVLVGGHYESGAAQLGCGAEPVSVDDVPLDDRVGFRCCASPDLTPEVSR